MPSDYIPHNLSSGGKHWRAATVRSARASATTWSPMRCQKAV